MITQRSMNYARVLEDLSVSKEDISNTKALLEEAPIVEDVLANPLVRSEEKVSVIKSLFPESMTKFMRLLCEHNAIGIWKDIFEAYDGFMLEKENKVKATLRYAMRMDNEDIEQVKEMICKKYNKAGVELDLIEDPSLIGGMVLKVNDTEYDKSIKGTLDEMQKSLVRR